MFCCLSPYGLMWQMFDGLWTWQHQHLQFEILNHSFEENLFQFPLEICFLQFLFKAVASQTAARMLPSPAISFDLCVVTNASKYQKQSTP